MLNDSADQSLLAPAPAYERDNIAGSPRPASPISIASTITAVGDISTNTSTTSFATFKARDVDPNDDWRSKPKSSKHIFQWWPEILAAGTSILSFVAIIIVLGRIDGTRLDQWRMFWKIQPSAVISVLITLCQMSLTPVIAEALSQLKWIYFEQRPQRVSDFEIFDEASRGPWGSVRLAYRLKWRASVASGGALLAVLALGMGPFTQQVLYTQVQHTQVTNTSAKIDASPFYNSGSMAAAVGVAGAQADQVVSPHNDSQSTTSTLDTLTFSPSTSIASTLSTSTLSALTSSTSTLDPATSYTSTSVPSTTVPSSSAPSTSDVSTSLTATDDSSTLSTSTPSTSSITPSTLGESTIDISQAFSTLALSTSTSSEFASSTATLVTSSESSQTVSESVISSSLTPSTTSPSTSIPRSSLSSVSPLDTTMLSSPTLSSSVFSTTTPSSPISTSVIVPSTSSFITSMSSSSARSTSVPSISSTITSVSSSSSSTEVYSVSQPEAYTAAPMYGLGGSTATVGGVTAPTYASKLRRREENSEDAQPGNTDCADSWMVQAAYAGLFASSTDNTFSCPTGNCTYPEFTSLGICGRCDDLTESVTRHCTGSTDSGQNCTFTLKGEENTKGEGIVFTANSTCGTRSRSGTAWQSRVMSLTQPESPEILTFHSLRLPTKYSGQADCEIARPVIRKCSLAWCAKTYSNTSVVNGQLKTQSILETPLVASTSQSSSCPGIESIAPPASAESVPWRRFVRRDRRCESIGPDNVFWVNSNDHATTRNMFTAILEDQEYAPGNPNIIIPFSQMATLQAFVENNNGDLGKTIANISTSMTNLVRSAMPAPRIRGIPSTTAIVYKVGWWWLLYPLAIILLAITFFIATIILSGERSRIIWKSSSLAVLSHGLDGFDSTELESHSLKGMSKEAKGLKARLQMNEEGKLKLVRCGP